MHSANDTLDAVCDHAKYVNMRSKNRVRRDYLRRHSLRSVPAKHEHNHKKGFDEILEERKNLRPEYYEINLDIRLND